MVSYCSVLSQASQAEVDNHSFDDEMVLNQANGSFAFDTPWANLRYVGQVAIGVFGI